MNIADFIVQMKQTLADERAAIRKLDSKGVLDASVRKEQLLKAVSNVPADQKPALLAALKELRGELRRNLVLLAHARECMREASAIMMKNPRRPRLQASV